MKKNISMQQFTVCIAGILLYGCVLLLPSCTEDVIDNNGNKKSVTTITGKDGNLNIVLNFDDYGEREDISMRSADDLAPETVVVSLGDGLSMFATLEQVNPATKTPSVALRSFTHDTRIFIVAYKQSLIPTIYKYEHHVGFVVDIAGSTSTLSRDGWGLAPFSLTVDSTYKFVAYSYNDNVTPLPPVSFPSIMNIEDIHPGLDLLWGTSGDIPIGSGSNIITINMTHQFSKVQLDALSNVGNISAITDVKMLGYTADLDVEEGDVTAYADSTMAFTGFSPLNTDSVSSTRIVYTAETNPTIVNIGSVTVGGNTYNNLTTTFARGLRSGYEYTLKMHFGNMKEVTDDPPPAGMNMYVGAFWKANQTGERLIRIPRPTSGAADGSWSATVISGADWIVLDKGWTSDAGVYGATPHTYETYPSFDVNHALPPTSSTVVMGNLRPNGSAGYEANDEYIRFRIGLKSTYTPSWAFPARYGVVLLTYHNNNLRQRIFIRQGEEPDFVMKPGDLTGSGSSAPDNRFKARKILPYNTTATTMDAVVDTIHAVIPVNPSKLTAYPSQAGAMFQWAGAGAAKRFAFNAYQSSISGWNTTGEAGFWNQLSPTQETCPPGYRRPNDGPEDNFYLTGDAFDSEMRQSLFLNPVSSTANSTANSVYGYYADGFFDRLTISSNSTVASGTQDIAHIGRLFYNPNNLASLFFPSAGYRHPDNSNMQNMGGSSAYWTSTIADNDYAWSMNFGPSDANFAYNHKQNTAASLRCVLEMLTATPRGVWLSPTTNNISKIIQLESQDAWEVVQPYPTNASLSATSGTGPTALTVTRSSTVFGLQIMTLRNLSNNELTYVAIDNYYIDDDDEFDIPNNLLTGNTGEFDIFVDGGSETFTIVSHSPWFTASITPAGKLLITADQTPDLEHRTGFITIAHADDPTYTATFPVEQDLFTTIPPFEYFVLKFTWATANDIDIAVEFAGNDLMTNGQPIPFNNDQYYTTGNANNYRALGWSLASMISPNGARAYSNPPSFDQQQLSNNLIFWGGDATQGQGETVFFNAPMITPPSRKLDTSGLPRKIYLDVYAHWYNGAANDPMRLRLMTYEGGVMSHYYDNTNVEPYKPDIRNYNFYNVDSYATPLIPSNLNLPVFDMDKVVVVDKRAVGLYTSFRTSFSKICTIEYDRYTRGAKVTWHAADYTGLVIVPRSGVANSMTKEERDRAAAEKEAHDAGMQKLK